MSDGPQMPGHCWERHPHREIHCLEEPGHRGDHYNWFTGRRWASRTKTTAQGRA
ncbi:hypothetical protein ACIOUE_01155 [Streptomyces xanthochromogenes]|uniref:hypothetical protein n=1 Tax=Streptomyces xanthochromogenes TaxID=67384 RepID=UPI0037F1586D